MKEVKFEYEIDQEVKTPFGDSGIITMLGYDDGEKCYYVRTSKDSQWYKEKQLTAGGIRSVR